MRREFAAQYCDLTMAALIRQVLVEKLPQPFSSDARSLGGGERSMRRCYGYMAGRKCLRQANDDAISSRH